MNLRSIWILYVRELRSALRERTIVVNSILMPIFLYPVMLWVLFSGFNLVQGLSEGVTSRVIFTTPAPAGHGELLDSIRAREGMSIVGWENLANAREVSESGALEGVPLFGEGEALARLREGNADVVVTFFEPPPEGQALPGNFRVRLRYDRAEGRSVQARDRVEAVVEVYRNLWMVRQAGTLGIDPEARFQFALSSENVSSSQDLGAMVLAQLISFFLVIMVALGCFVPAVDTTAGERERSTWETLMTVAASRASMVTAKYLYVATLGIAAGALNVVALFISIGAVIRPLLEDAGESITFSIPLKAIPIMMAGAASLAFFFAAAMMILASFARSFKDGQAMVQPVYWLIFLPFILGGQTDRNLTPAIASIPVANVSMMIRDAVTGVFIWPLIAQTLIVTLATVLLCLVAARYVLRFEDFLLGSFDGSFWRFVRDRMSAGKNGTAY
ncbi:MAG: ABC transporter permease [Gemmatimonadales bacterium]|nr:MAG: ABC transporter permease [Gemmatimonadales bacterium]